MMTRLRLGQGKRSVVKSFLLLGVGVTIAGWSYIVKPAMIRAEEWSGTVVAMDTVRVTSSDRKRHMYLLTIDCGDKRRRVEVSEELFKEARKGSRVEKVKGERLPRLP